MRRNLILSRPLILDSKRWRQQIIHAASGLNLMPRLAQASHFLQEPVHYVILIQPWYIFTDSILYCSYVGGYVET